MLAAFSPIYYLMPTTIVFVRHGETADNVADIWSGWRNVALDARGGRQARDVAKRLKAVDFDAAYSSDLLRARQTAEAILLFHRQLPLDATSAIREKDFGLFEGYTEAGLRMNFPKEFEEYMAAADRIKVHCPSGESWEDVLKRSSGFIRKILKERPNQTLLVVSHGGCIRLLLAWLLNAPLPEHILFDHNNTGVSVVEVSPSLKTKLRLFNDTSHTKAPF